MDGLIPWMNIGHLRFILNWFNFLTWHIWIIGRSLTALAWTVLHFKAAVLKQNKQERMKTYH